jgi:hypothetical protein
MNKNNLTKKISNYAILTGYMIYVKVPSVGWVEVASRRSAAKRALAEAPPSAPWTIFKRTTLTQPLFEITSLRCATFRALWNNKIDYTVALLEL